MNPILKYRGGKSKEIQFFEKYIPQKFNCYFEPFFGGGALFFYLEPEKSFLNDINRNVMNFYSDIKYNYYDVRKQIDELQNIYEKNQAEFLKAKEQSPNIHIENKNEALYYYLRDMFNHKIPYEYLESVVYYFINKTSYSGMIRYNKKGEFNVPFGRYKNLNAKLITDSHAELLGRANLFCSDYIELFRMAEKNDFMFLDPPYDCIFNDYGNIDKEKGFDEEEHIRLATNYKQLRCKALMVIGKTPLTEHLYKDYIRDEYDKLYSVNIRNRFKARAKHLIISNY